MKLHVLVGKPNNVCVSVVNKTPKVFSEGGARENGGIPAAQLTGKCFPANQ